MCKGKDILEMGCGFGCGGYYLLLKGAKSYTGIDINPDAIKYATTHFLNKIHGMEFFVADALNFDIKRKFDVIISLEVIEHLGNVKNCMKYLKNSKRLLKDDGIFIFITPNNDETLRKYYKTPIFHSCEFTEHNLKRILEKYFRIIEFKGIKGNWTLMNVIRLDLMEFIKPILPYKIQEYYLDKSMLKISKIKSVKFTNTNPQLFFGVCKLKNLSSSH